MIGGINGGSQVIALLQGRLAGTTSPTMAVKGAKNVDPKEAKAAEEKRQRAEELRQSLTQSNSDVRKQRKAAAAQKVERLKRELQALQMFNGIGDPKAVARQAARIARELSAAAKEYASGGGGGADGPAAAGATGDAAEAAQPGMADAQNAAGAASAEAAAGAASTATTKGEGGEGEVSTDDSAEGGANVQAAEAMAAQVQAAAKISSPEEQRAALVDKINALFSEREQRAGEAKADQEFANEVRSLYDQVKALFEQQRRQAAEQNEDDPEFEQFAKDMASAGNAIEQAFSSEGMAMMTPPAPVDITV